MKIIIVGTSLIAESFKKACDIAGGIECVGVYSRTLESGKKFCEKTGVERVFTDFDKAAKYDGAEAVYIASPNSCHFEQCKTVLENSKHVLCEKPITTSAEEFDILSEMANDKKLVFLQALMMFYSPNFSLLENEIKSIGNISSVHFDFSQLSSKYQLYLDGKNPNVFNPEMKGGSLFDLGIYTVSLSARLFGKPKSVFSHRIFLDNGVDSSGSAVFSFDGFDVILTYSKTGQSRAVSQIIGDEATLTIGSVSKLCDIRRIDKYGNSVCVAPDITQEQAMSYEAEVFKNAVENRLDGKDFFDMCHGVSKLTAQLIDRMKK